MNKSICNFTDSELLTELLGSEAAQALAGKRMSEIFGFEDPRHAFIGENEPVRPYVVHPIIEVTKELVTRAFAARMALPDYCFNSLPLVKSYLGLKLGSLKHEEFHCVWVDSQHRLIAHQQVSIGSICETRVYPRELVKAALNLNAHAVFLAHNHPSGDQLPSPADRQITTKISRALACIDVKVLDHIIVAGNKAFSFHDAGLI